MRAEVILLVLPSGSPAFCTSYLLCIGLVADVEIALYIALLRRPLSRHRARRGSQSRPACVDRVKSIRGRRCITALLLVPEFALLVSSHRRILPVTVIVVFEFDHILLQGAQ